MEKTKLQHLSIKGNPTKSDKKLILDAVEYGVDKLLSRQLQPHVTVIIKLKSKFKKDFEGDCEIIGFGRKNAPRHFFIRVIYKPGRPGKTLTTIFHELVHVKQFATGEVNPLLTTWKGESHEDTKYWDTPWEVEAYGRQAGLYTRFVKKKKLSRKELYGEEACIRK